MLCHARVDATGCGVGLENTVNMGLWADGWEFIQLCPILCGPLDYSLPVSFVLGIFQAKILEWLAIPYSKGSSRHRDPTYVSCISCDGRQILYH